MGIALGGGAARGAAHIGVLRALEEHDLRPDFIAGTSIGALVGGLYAAGVSVDRLRDAAREMRWLDIAGATLSKFGLLSNQELKKLVHNLAGDRQIEDLDVPFAALATDIASGERVVLRQGSLADAVMASACVPGVFVPPKLDGRMLVDGGLVENVPISPLRDMGADVVLAVNLNGAQSYQQPEGLIDVVLNAIDIAIDNSTRMQMKQADVQINLDLAEYFRGDSRDVRELIAEGYRGAALRLKEIERALDARQQTTWDIIEEKFRQWREGDA